MRMRTFLELMYMETLVNGWSFWLALEQILVTLSLKLSILTPNNTSSLLAFLVDPIIFVCLSTNGLSKKCNFPGLFLKPFLWNHSQILEISVSSFSIILTSKFYCAIFHKLMTYVNMKRRGPSGEPCGTPKRMFRKSMKMEPIFVFHFD